MSGVVPQLLNPIEEDAIAALLMDDRYCAQEKFDGKRIMLRRSGAAVTGINKKGLTVGLPETIAKAAELIPTDFLMDGEAVGDRYYAFDLLELGSDDLRGRTYRDRLIALINLLASVQQRGIVFVDTAHLAADKRRMLAALNIQTAEAVAPCVVLVDEVEKAFAGSKSSGSTDGGTASRVFGSFLTWLQEKTAPVFVVMTANDVTQLPPEFLRKGRLDEIFFVDLPGKAEREAIWSIHIRKYGRDPAKYDVQALAKATEGLTGAEIEQAFIDALYAAFAEGREPTTLAVSLVLNDLVPLSRLMGEQIQALRTWAKGRARPATTPIEQASGRKLAA